MSEKVEITKERFEELLKAEETLQILQAGGVDNWCGYDEAFEMAEEWAKEVV